MCILQAFRVKESLVDFVGKLFVVKEVSYFEWFDHFDLMHFRPFSEPSGDFLEISLQMWMSLE